MTSGRPRQKIWMLFRKTAKFSFKTTILLMVLYSVVILIGLIPVNREFENAGQSGVEILVVSNGVHAELIVPLESRDETWKQFFANSDFHSKLATAKFLAFGWGDHGFFVNTPTWGEFETSTALNALCLPSNTVMHVTAVSDEDDIWSGARRVKLSSAQYQRMVQFIQSSFETQQGQPCQIPDEAYDLDDAFFSATGNYHLLNTCNSWVGRGLREGGVKVGQYTPLPKTVFLYLPD